MRAIHLAKLDKTRPALVLTREPVIPHLRRVTVAPITSTIMGLGTEVLVGPANGLDQECVVSCDNVTTVDRSNLGRLVGYFFTYQEDALRDALIYAYGLLGSHPDPG